MHNVIKINGDLFFIKRAMSDRYEKLASEWNNLSPKHKTFKQNNKLFFCELIEELTIIEENVDTPTV